MRLPIPLLGLAMAAALLPAGRAWADAIDGQWCFSDGRLMSIDGPRIVTPGGIRTTGDYDRHGFAYTVPDGEAGAGSALSMILVSDDILHLTNPAKARTEVWHRCSRPSS